MQDGIIEFDLCITPIQVLFFEKNHFFKEKKNSKICYVSSNPLATLLIDTNFFDIVYILNCDIDTIF